MTDVKRLLLMIWPLLLLQLSLQVYSIVDLVRRKKVRFGNKYIWGAIILVGGVLGPIVYLTLRGEEE